MRRGNDKKRRLPFESLTPYAHLSFAESVCNHHPISSIHMTFLHTCSYSHCDHHWPPETHVYGGAHCVEPVYPWPPHCPHWGTSEPVGDAPLEVDVAVRVAVVNVVGVAVVEVVVGGDTALPRAETTLARKPVLA